MKAAKTLNDLEDNLTTMISQVVKLRKLLNEKVNGKVIYLELVKDVEEETDTIERLPLCAEEE